MLCFIRLRIMIWYIMLWSFFDLTEVGVSTGCNEASGCNQPEGICLDSLTCVCNGGFCNLGCQSSPSGCEGTDCANGLWSPTDDKCVCNGSFGRGVNGNCTEDGESPCSPSCTDLGYCRESSDPGVFFCDCVLGTADCVDRCLPNPCQNGGTCTEDGQGGFTCQCTKKYVGVVCDKPC